MNNLREEKKLKLNPCRKCKTTKKLRVMTFLGICKVECSCGTATAWQKSMEEAENTWNRKEFDNE